MTVEETKARLMRVQWIGKEIEALSKARREAWDLVTVKTSRFGGMRSGTPDPHKFDRLVDLGDLIDTRTSQLLELEKEAVEAINQVDKEQQRVLLIKRYINGEGFEQIAEDMHYSTRMVFKIHGDALNAVSKVYGNQAKSNNKKIYSYLEVK